MSRFQTEQEQPHSLDSLFKLLSDHHRRLLLQYFLHQETATATLDDLVRYISQHDDETTDEHIRLQLTHTHLPMFIDYGVLEKEQQDKTVSYAGSDQLESLLTVTLPDETAD